MGLTFRHEANSVCYTLIRVEEDKAAIHLPDVASFFEFAKENRVVLFADYVNTGADGLAEMILEACARNKEAQNSEKEGKGKNRVEKSKTKWVVEMKD